jgi:hypothetical protein
MIAPDRFYLSLTKPAKGVIAGRLAALKARIVRALALSHDPADHYSQREFIQEVMARNPDAFHSDWDVEAFLRYCP